MITFFSDARERLAVRLRSPSRFLAYACKPCRYRQVEDYIFICYRQSDTLTVAKSLEDLLDDQFPGRIFRDVGAILPGDIWRETIDTALQRSTAVLVLIGPTWLTVDRLGRPNDQVRYEIEQALGLWPTTRVIPILVDGTQMPAPQELPSSIALLPNHQAAQIRSECFVEDALRLSKRLKTPPPPRFLNWKELRGQPVAALVANALWRPLWSNVLLPLTLLIAALTISGASWLLAVAALLYVVLFTVTLFDRQQVRCVEQGLRMLKVATTPAPEPGASRYTAGSARASCVKTSAEARMHEFTVLRSKQAEVGRNAAVEITDCPHAAGTP